MTYEQLESLSAEKLEPPLQVFVNYSLAVREVRRENYARAAAGLEKSLKQEEALTAGQFILSFDYVNDFDCFRWNFWKDSRNDFRLHARKNIRCKEFMV